MSILLCKLMWQNFSWSKGSFIDKNKTLNIDAQGFDRSFDSFFKTGVFLPSEFSESFGATVFQRINESCEPSRLYIISPCMFASFQPFGIKCLRYFFQDQSKLIWAAASNW